MKKKVLLFCSLEDDAFVHILHDIVHVFDDVALGVEDLVGAKVDSDTFTFRDVHLVSCESLVSDTRHFRFLDGERFEMVGCEIRVCVRSNVESAFHEDELDSNVRV